MLSSIQNQIASTTKTHFETQLALWTDLTSKALESVVKLTGLNMTVVKDSLDESTFITQQFLLVKDPREFFSLTAAQAQPNIEKAFTYSRQVAGIASGIRAELAKAAQAHITETNRNYEQLAKTTKQAAETTGANRTVA